MEFGFTEKQEALRKELPHYYAIELPEDLQVPHWDIWLNQYKG